MPTWETHATSTTAIAAGWTNPTNAYVFDGSYAYSETDDAEQEYTGYKFPLGGVEIIDKVFIKLKDLRNLTTIVQGDAASFEGSIKVYDGSSWTTYQITADDFAVSTANDESLTYQSGDASNNIYYIDVTSALNTVAKLKNAKTRLLFNISATAVGITVRWSIDAITILVCYSYSYTVPATRGSAQTKRDLPTKEVQALKNVSNYLKTASQSHT